MISVNILHTEYAFDEKTNTVTVAKPGKAWRPQADFRPYLSALVGKSAKQVLLYFDEAQGICTKKYETGVAVGIAATYSGWMLNGKCVSLQLGTLTWVHKTTGKVYFEVFPLNEPASLSIKEVHWPVPWQWERTDAKAYTLFPVLYGMMIPSDWDETITMVGNNRFCTTWGNMAWYGQIDHGNGYMTIIGTPWDANFHYYHPAEKDPTQMWMYWVSSLGKLRYRRIQHVEFFEDCNYVTMCKAYRRYMREHNEIITLAQKVADNPKIQHLCGSPIIHSCIYYSIKPEAFIYNEENPNRNYRFTTFDRRADAIRELAQKGLKKGYLHLDGWGREGYDREHPDVLPPCEKAGGYPSMKRLQDVCHENNVLLTLHDQYRDYYYDAASFDFDNAQQSVDGKHPFECTWNGGDQSILCNALAPYYIERNYDRLHDLGIDPDGVYLDVFSTVDLDECNNPRHRITRKESAEYRHYCLNLLASRGMIISSESPVDIFAKDIVLCHHFSIVREYFSKDMGVHVPLFNLAFHDCMIVPWPTHYEEDPEVIMTFRYLLALLNGGPAYLEIDADEEQMKRIDVVSQLQEKVMYSEMVSHEFLDGGYTKQRTWFSNGVTVTVDFTSGEYTIEA